MARRFTTLLALVVFASVLTPTAVEASPREEGAQLAQMAAPAPDDPIRVPLGEVLVRGLLYHEPTERVIVAADDQVRIFDVNGRQTAAIAVSGAIDPTAAGNLVVVGSPTDDELVVIDPAAGSVVRRIASGARGLASIAVVGDRIWYAHDGWPEGFGIASVSAGTATPSQAIDRRVPFQEGIQIDVSPANPDRVYAVNPQLSPSVLAWGGLDGSYRRAPMQESYDPFVLSRSGDVIWAMFEGSLVEFDAETLDEVGFRFERPMATRPITNGARLASHADERLVVAIGDTITQYDVGRSDAVSSTTFAGHVRAIDVSDRHLFAAISDNAQSSRPPKSLSELIIMDRDQPAPAPVASIAFFGYGEPSSTERGSVLVRCGDASATVDIRYGYGIDLTLPIGTTQCSFRASGGPEPLDRQLSTRSEDRDGPFVSLQISSVASENWVELYDDHPSVYSDPAVFTRQMFNDLLDREPTAGEAASWRSQIDRGAELSGLAAGLVETPEYFSQVEPVTRLYRAYFLRQPDDPGLAYWLGQVRNGLSIPDISWLFSTSVEFQRRYGATLTDAEFIDLVYRNVLRRPPDPDGARYWAGILASGVTRGRVMTSFSEGREFVRRTRSIIAVRAIYSGLVGREPEADEEAQWRSIHESGQPLDALVERLINSTEYEDRFWIKDEAPQP